MKNLKYILFSSMIAAMFSCSLLEPEPENRSNFDRVLSDPFWTDGLLVRGYVALNYSVYGSPFRWDEVATDDAVSNNPFNNYRVIADGSWSSVFNPQNVWATCFEGIQYINSFLEVVDEQVFRVEDQLMDELYKRRLKGEAYALRGILKYVLLRHHGGVGADGQLWGTPIFNEFLTFDADFTRPREKFSDCVRSAYEDMDVALEMLPFDYFKVNNVDDFPENFSDLKIGSSAEILAKIAAYNFTCGDKIRQRVSGRITLAYKLRLALLHASPAFNEGNESLWEKAADIAGILLDDVGGPSGLDPLGHIFWLGSQVERCDLNANPPKDMPEYIWRKPNNENKADYELDNFPPSCQGYGRINPTQNFVETFPMLDGYPIGQSSTYRYDAQNPYVGRDPRLLQIVVCNGTSFKSRTINTGIGLGLDCLESLPTSTRTGYYLKKLLREDVNVGTTVTLQRHIDPFIRYTEVFLAYAEAANEAYGPTGDPKGRGYHAKSIIKAIRERAGIEGSDSYLVSINNKDDMRKMIHNERRIELSFESFRFWDLRRWSKPGQLYDKLNETVQGVRIEDGVYGRFDVEERKYRDHMIYGPVPKSDIDKFKYIQNNGW